MAFVDLLKQLREQTSVSMLECKKALQEAGNDIKRAKEILREKGKLTSKNRDGRTTQKGLIESYIHAGCKIGVLLQLNCESDFVAKSEEFHKLAHEICLHIAASNPLFRTPDDISEDFLDGEKKIYQKQFVDSGKPHELVEQIIEGKLKKYKEEVSLLKQPWIKDPSKTIQDLIDEFRARIGENIEIGKFVRFEV